MYTFALITHARTGTQTLRNAFALHPSISLFEYWLDANHPIALEDIELRTDYELNWHHRAWEHFLESTPPDKTHLCTWTHYMSDAWLRENTPAKEGFWHLLSDTNQQVVLLDRRNLLRQYLSIQVANSTGQFSTDAPRSAEPPPIHVLANADIEQFVDRQRAADEKLHAVMAGKYLQVTYEDLVSDWTGTFGRLQEDLGMPVVDIPIPTYRQEHRPIRDIVTNYDELEAYLVRQGWDDWLDD